MFSEGQMKNTHLFITLGDFPPIPYTLIFADLQVTGLVGIRDTHGCKAKCYLFC